MRTGSDGEQPFVVFVNGEFLQGLMIASRAIVKVYDCVLMEELNIIVLLVQVQVNYTLK